MEKIYEEGLKILAENPDLVPEAIDILDSELSMPNIPFPTMGGEVFWNTLASFNGWRLQQNMLTHHARILDPEDIRRAWGTINGMEKAMNRMVSSLKKYQREEQDLLESRSKQAEEQLKRIKMLLDAGILTKEEYEEKKKEYLKDL